MSIPTTPEERLAAWLDGALSPEEALAFEAELAADPALAERAASWRGNDAAIVRAFAPLAEAPIDPAMLARLGLAPAAANDNPPWWRRHAAPLGGALAASLAAILLLVPRGETPQDALSLALDTTPSASAIRLADGRRFEPMLTLRAADGRWCREYRVETSRALACREGGRWKVEAEARSGGSPQQGEIVLAGGASDAALDAAYTRLGAGDPLGREAEAALIQSKWGGR